jgi:hypothetical protein
MLGEICHYYCLDIRIEFLYFSFFYYNKGQEPSLVSLIKVKGAQTLCLLLLSCILRKRETLSLPPIVIVQFSARNKGGDAKFTPHGHYLLKINKNEGEHENLFPHCCPLHGMNNIFYFIFYFSLCKNNKNDYYQK